VGAGVGLGEALAPPDVEVGGRREEPLLLLLGAEVRDDRADHVGVERQRWRHARELHLLVPDVALQRRPVPAAPLDGPVRHREAGLVEDLLGLDDCVLADVVAGRDRVADLLRDLGGEERAHLLAERALLLGEVQLHAARLPGGRGTLNGIYPRWVWVAAPWS